jgi:hypothetical protein
MKRVALGLFAVLSAGACVHNGNLEQVRAGMSQSEVVAIMGPPESSMHSPGRDCAVYSVVKDFWSRVPWNMSNKYYVCYVDGRVDYFGRADQPDVRTSLRQ